MRAVLLVIALFLAQGICSQNVMSFNAEDIRERGIYDIRDLTTVVPGLFVTSLGSAQSTAVYMRGVGSRVNAPVVGIYVDDIPWLDKSSFNSKVGEIERIEVLRGPQYTLYGRNTMGGVIRITTKNPLDYQGTVIERSMANHYTHYTSFSHYQRFSDKLGFTAGVAYRSGGQFFNHSISGLKADADRSLRTHARLLYRPNNLMKVDFLANYELCSQDAFPYYLESVSDNDYFKDQLTPDIGRITSNDDNTYLRHLLNIGFKSECSFSKMTLRNVLAFQLLNDETKMDGDFSHLSICTFQQIQRNRTLTEEITLKSKSGAWGGWEWSTGASFFYQWLHQHFSSGLQAENPFGVRTNSNGFALYHQSRFRDILNAKGLDFTLGLRLEYEHLCLSSISNGWWQLTPRFSLQYSFSKGNVYGTVSRGYKSGGFNWSVSDVPSLYLYKPEYAWNYEIGTRLNFLRDKLYVNASVFLTDISDQQIKQMDPVGERQIISNAGRSKSLGGEFTVHSQITGHLHAHASYGYTHATFTEYMLSSDVSCNGNYLPLSPLHSVDAGVKYGIPLPKTLGRQFLDRMMISCNWHGLGKVYWTEDNQVYEPFYSALDAKITFYRKYLEFGVWAANIYDSRCRTYYFQSMGRGYSQLNKPFQCGFEMKLNF